MEQFSELHQVLDALTKKDVEPALQCVSLLISLLNYNKFLYNFKLSFLN